MVLRKKKKTQQREEPEFGWQNISLWENDNAKSNAVLSGKITFTPEFLDDLLERVQDEEVEIDDRGYITLNVSIRENDNEKANSPIYLGSIYVPEPQEEEKKPARKTRNTGRRKLQDDDDDDDDDEPAVDPRRKGRTQRATRSR